MFKKKKVDPEPVPGDPDYMALKVTVYHAHVPKRDPKTKMGGDVFAVVIYNGVERTTKVMHRTSRPKWDETFEFPIARADQKRLTEVFIQIYDENGHKKRKSQTFFGEVRLALADLANTSFEYAQPRRYKLGGERGNKKDKIQGNVELKVGLVLPKGAPVKNQPAELEAGTSGGRMSEKAKQTQKVIEEAEDVVDDTYDSVQRALRVAENTKRIGSETMEKLDHQGKQLRSIQGDLDDISHLQDKADRHMRGIESVAGYYANHVTSSGRAKDNNRKADREIDKLRKAEAKDKQLAEREERRRQRKQHGRSRDRGEEDHREYQPDFSMLSEEKQQKIKDTDSALDRLGDLVSDLGEMALEIRGELQDHNIRLDKVRDSSRQNNERMERTNRKIRKQVGS
ncbi:phosphatidylserine decarboxylase [Balamuthia mandrillaris]